jgi:hypothetical protein
MASTLLQYWTDADGKKRLLSWRRRKRTLKNTSTLSKLGKRNRLNFEKKRRRR